MAGPKFIDIDGKRFVWRELLQRRREQLAAAARAEQPVLFELKEIAALCLNAPPPDVIASRACSACPGGRPESPATVSRFRLLALAR